MIEFLRIKNLILMELCEIHFGTGLTIITGETGAGKTALLQGLELILGQRADSSSIRKGAKTALIEACFDISAQEHLLDLLKDVGIEYSSSEPLIISRELSLEGKSRSFINRHPVPVSTLQLIGKSLVHIISQHTYHELKSLEAQREILDQFGDYRDLLDSFKKALFQHKSLAERKEYLTKQMLEKERNASRYLDEKEELENARLKEDEEEELFETYSLHSRSQEITQQASRISCSLSSGPKAILKELLAHKLSCENLVGVHQQFSPIHLLLQEAIVALQEVDHSLQSLTSSLDNDPISLERMEKRLEQYAKIKKKYGPTFSDWQTHLQFLDDTLRLWDELEFEISTLKQKEMQSLQLLEEISSLLTQKRKESAKKLSLQLSSSLKELNMPDAEVIIEVKKGQRSHFGDDVVQFFLQANKGEKPSSIKDSTSGGELSRLLLAIKVSLLEKNNTSTIIFDEIDANVGGTTASLMAEKLSALSKCKQVFCITHFPQMAKKADTHMKVFKEEIENRTVSRLMILSKSEKHQEILRMLGEEKSLPSSSKNLKL